MSIKRISQIPGGPPALGPYSPAVVVGNFVFVSGQTPWSPEMHGIHRGTIAEQTALTLANLDKVLKAAGTDRNHVVSCRIFLSELTPETFREMNKIYQAFFGDHKPARTTIGCQLLGMDVEIDAIAVLPEKA
ncbi:MAG: RidA family protein [Chthoniobacterales bacterium]|nr:RidA family protein [Chthoniobacterales bacterium]MCX7712959.1 RidA family protein [Chthoniobacterales bacterium]